MDFRFRPMGPPFGHPCISVQGPRLASRPGRIVGIPLDGLLAEDRSVIVVINEMPDSSILPEMVLQRREGMFFRDFPVSGSIQQLQVHHVVDDDRNVPRAPVPAADDAGLRDKTRRQLRRAAGKDVVHLGRVGSLDPAA